MSSFNSSNDNNSLFKFNTAASNSTDKNAVGSSTASPFTFNFGTPKSAEASSTAPKDGAEGSKAPSFQTNAGSSAAPGPQSAFKFDLGKTPAFTGFSSNPTPPNPITSNTNQQASAGTDPVSNNSQATSSMGGFASLAKPATTTGTNMFSNAFKVGSTQPAVSSPLASGLVASASNLTTPAISSAQPTTNNSNTDQGSTTNPPAIKNPDSSTTTTAPPATGFTSSFKPSPTPQFTFGSSSLSSNKPKTETNLFGSSSSTSTPLTAETKPEVKPSFSFSSGLLTSQAPSASQADDKKNVLSSTSITGSQDVKKTEPEKPKLPAFGSSVGLSSQPQQPSTPQTSTFSFNTPFKAQSETSNTNKPLFQTNNDASTGKLPTSDSGKDIKPVSSLGQTLTNNKATETSQPNNSSASDDKSKLPSSEKNPFDENKKDQEPFNRLKSKTMEEIISRWASDLDTQLKLFTDQAEQISKWDRLLVDNGDKISRLYSSAIEAEQVQERVDLTLSYIESQQNELDYMLKQYTEQAQDLIEMNIGTADSIQPVDRERQKSLSLATQYIERLESMGKNLEVMILDINRVGSGISNKKSDSPSANILRILNSHMSSLSWIDKNVEKIQELLSKLKQGEQETEFLIQNLESSIHQQQPF